jgi:hypothetical protein
MAASQPPPDIPGIVNFVGSLFAILGIPLTFWRIRRTNKAVDKTERTIANYQVLRLLPQLGTFEVQLDAAVNAGERDAAVTALIEWKSAANRLQGLLAGMKEHDEFRGELKSAVALASTAKQQLGTMKTFSGSTIERHTRDFRASATNISNEADVLETRLSSRTSGGLE